jgi:CRP-like cAMP-binding protein
VFFRLGARSSEVVFLPTSKAIRFFLIRLAVPWLLSGVCFLLAGRVEEPLFSYIGLGFLIQAVLDFSPFHRSLLICFCEWLTATLDFQDRVLKYLYDRMFVSLFEKRLNTVQRFIDDFLISTTAAMGIAWLYGVGLILIDLVVFTLPSLWNHIPYAPISFRSVSASLLILGMAFAMTYVTGLLFFITGSNLFSVLDVPLRKARRAWLLSYTYSSKEAIETFLKNHPLFESLQEFEIREVALLFRKKRYEMGQVVIRQGEEGDEFFILLEGETQVFRENSNGTSDLLSILYSGDSFGETALIEKCNRTATVRASKHCVLLSLSTKNFQKLFSVNSGKAKDFTNLIRNIKLIQDSQALSHLTATEIRKLLQKSNEVVFEKGQAVVERGEEADEVFIIKEGEAAVFIDGQTVAKAAR